MAKNMICYFIFADGAAKGGHYRSLTTIAEAASSTHKCVVINVGYIHSPVIMRSKLESHYIHFNGLNLIMVIKKIKRIVDLEKVTCVHAFDSKSYLVARVLSKQLKIPAIVTKCGGPVPRNYFPIANYITLFSQEDNVYFSKNPRFKSSLVRLIPNRASSFESDQKMVNHLLDKFNLRNKRVFLRICRIAEYYKKSLFQSINLVKELKEKFPNIALLIVGNIQSQEVLDELRDTSSEEYIFFETEEIITMDAKKIIDVADFVIGTGRGFMEATGKGKVLLTPSKSGEFPVLINENNFEVAFEKNFSERIVFDDVVLKRNFQEIVKLLEDKDKCDQAKRKSVEWFEEHFSIEHAIETYTALYDSLEYKEESKLDILNHWRFAIVNNFGAWYRYGKKWLIE
jgi:glycosyltransferase involved in cell wall biosynthesis